MSSDVERYEILVLGGGKAGKTLAMDMARSGRRVAMVERGMIGGACINVACIPTKALVRSAEMAELPRDAAAQGVISGRTEVQMPGVAARTARIVGELVDLQLRAFEASGLELVVGEGRFVASRVVEATLPDGATRRLTGERIFLDLGTTAFVPELPGLRAAAPLTHVEALRLDRVLEHLVILGGGYVGLELGQAFRRLGSAVTIVERGPRLAAREDPDIAAAVLDVFREEGVDVLLDAELKGVEGRSGSGVTLRVAGREGERALRGSDILVAAGRVAQTAGIGLDTAGVELDPRGFVVVDERLATTAPGIWAMGECAGSPMFTHVALDDYRVVRSGILGGARTTRSRLVPYAVFTDPELGRVGLGEAEAARRGLAVRVARSPVSAVPRARTLSRTRGLMKAVVDAGSDRILGFAMLGAHAGEVTAVVQAAMWGDLPYTALRDGIIAHPTMAEGLNVLFADLPGR